jgi:hypothetical protein
MKKIFILAALMTSLSLKSQGIRINQDSIRTFVDPSTGRMFSLQPIEFTKNSNSGQMFKSASNAQLSSLGLAILGAFVLQKGFKDHAASITDNTKDPTDSYFLAGGLFVASIGCEVSYLHKFRSASKRLSIEQEKERLERERVQSKIQELEKQISDLSSK